MSHFTWPVQGTNVSVSSSVFHGEMFPRAGINPSFTTFNALRWFWEWYEYFFLVFAISLSDFGSFSGNLESLEHFPQQQCFVLTIFNWNYLDYLSHLVLFAFRHLRCLFESCGGSYKTYISIFRTTHCAMRPSLASMLKRSMFKQTPQRRTSGGNKFSSISVTTKCAWLLNRNTPNHQIMDPDDPKSKKNNLTPSKEEITDDESVEEVIACVSAKKKAARRKRMMISDDEQDEK